MALVDEVLDSVSTGAAATVATSPVASAPHVQVRGRCDYLKPSPKAAEREKRKSELSQLRERASASINSVNAHFDVSAAEGCGAAQEGFVPTPTAGEHRLDTQEEPLCGPPGGALRN